MTKSMGQALSAHLSGFDAKGVEYTITLPAASEWPMAVVEHSPSYLLLSGVDGNADDCIVYVNLNTVQTVMVNTMVDTDQ
jgi:hypothetical protein